MQRLVVAACLTFTAGCATFRAGWKDLHNDDWIGDPAPALSVAGGAEWIGGEARVDGSWYLVAFLLPW